MKRERGNHVQNMGLGVGTTSKLSGPSGKLGFGWGIYNIVTLKPRE